MLNSKISTALLLALCLYSVTKILSFKNVTFEEDKLVFAQIIFRHGDRNPLKSYPNDPWADESYWPSGYGELTNRGKKLHFDLGKYFRKRYRTLLGNGSYSKNIIYIQSTDVDRTIMSAASNMAGLFPPKDEQVWNENLMWQPMPIHVIPLSIDYVVNAELPCPRYNEAMKKYENSPEFQTMLKKHKPLFEYVEEHSGMPIRTLRDLHDFNNTLYIQSITNKTLPEWTKKIFVPDGDMQMLAAFTFQVNTTTPVLARLKAGFLWRDLMDRFSEKIESKLKPDRSLWIYSAHDATIANILNSIGLFELHTPPYAASLLFELYKSNDGFYFQLFYRKWNHVLRPLNIPLCGTKCSVDKFREAYAEIIPTGSFVDECKL